MSTSQIPLVVIRGGQPWILGPTFVHSAAYRHHRISRQRLRRSLDVLERLENLVVRLRRVATIDRKPAATREEWIRRSAEKTDAWFEHVCMVHDLRRGVGYVVRFLNTTALYASGTPQQRAFAQRAERVIHELLFRQDWRGRGRRRLAHAPTDVQATRADVLGAVREIWSVCDLSDRRAALVKVAADRGWHLHDVPLTIGRKFPSRVADWVVRQHTGVGLRRLRRTGVSAKSPRALSRKRGTLRALDWRRSLPSDRRSSAPQWQWHRRRR
jgi:hypothetical protein